MTTAQFSDSPVQDPSLMEAKGPDILFSCKICSSLREPMCFFHSTNNCILNILIFKNTDFLILNFTVLVIESERVSPSVMSNSLRQPPGLYCVWNSPGKNTGLSFHSLLQEIFPTQGSNLGLLHCRQVLYQLSYEGSPILFPRLLKFNISRR